MNAYEKIFRLYSDTTKELLELPNFYADISKGFDLLEKQIKEAEQRYKEEKSFQSKDKLTSLESLKSKIRSQSNFEFIRPIHLDKVNKAIFIYACSIFDVFLSDLTRELYLTYPKTLYSKTKTISYQELFSADIEYLKEKIIEKEIYELGYKRIDDRVKFIAQKFGLTLTFNEEEQKFFTKEINLPSLIEIFANRNIIIHNRSIINKNHLEIVNNRDYQEGQILPISNKITGDSIMLLLKMVTCLFNSVEDKLTD